LLGRESRETSPRAISEVRVVHIKKQWKGDKKSLHLRRNTKGEKGANSVRTFRKVKGKGQSGGLKEGKGRKQVREGKNRKVGSGERKGRGKKRNRGNTLGKKTVAVSGNISEKGQKIRHSGSSVRRKTKGTLRGRSMPLEVSGKWREKRKTHKKANSLVRKALRWVQQKDRGKRGR